MELNQILQTVFLGVLQGVTEFIPVSSSGHVDVVPQLLGWDKPSTLFILLSHTGTLIAVIWYFRKLLWKYTLAVIKLAQARFKFEQVETHAARVNLRQIGIVAIATIPAAILGALVESRVEGFYDDPANAESGILLTMLAMFALGLVFLSYQQYIHPRIHDLHTVGWKKALIIGVAQCLAFVRGTSRSGITLVVGQFAGLDRQTAAELSFLMSVPLIAGSTGLAVLKLSALDPATLQNQLTLGVIGLVSAMVSGYLAIRFLMNYLRNNSLQVFGWYRIVFAIIVLLILMA
jgi:undecaprenyl-diphosphatase